jgi:phospholipid N-methyltransferase
MNFDNYREFLGGVLRNPKSFSTLFPTGHYLSEQLAQLGQVEQSSSVLELGAGSGAITGTLLKHLNSEAEFYGLELDAPLVEHLRELFPDHRFEAGSATKISEIFPGLQFDTIIASLPWTLFDADEKTKIITEIHKSLSPHGELIFFITKHVDQTSSANELKKLFEQSHFEIQTGPSVWLNLPPANLYKAKRKKL